ncbi:Cbb3-type cytochrome c oxidase subunit CcoP2 [Pedobacter glucosidilyticus]|nr:cbb3-type cytochrome c oxidase N-terminal domain-containing protein [Pedobacter glucosidilyticus]KHJ38067.1 Cbb3-type cytochrome c oxidase subunit CcoP2 [Pedobacter glucosidilyticus]
MKFIKPIFVFMMLLLTAQSTFAANGELMNNIALVAILAMLVLIGIVCLVLLKTFKVMAALLLKPEEAKAAAATENHPDYEFVLQAEKPTKPTFWQKVLSLRPISEEKDMMIDHDYDGIQELDNPTPGWFMYLFYATIAFAFVYILNFHVFNLGKLQDEEYAIEVKEAETAKAAFLAQSANNVDENTVALSTDAGVIAEGKALYTKNCVACHGANGEGTVGPNLTDEYWIHGGKINNVFKTIKYGVPEKGMVSWEKQLTPKQISDVANYIKSLAGTNPPNGKEPQGDKES